MNRIIIDTDPGVDDSMAILLAFHSPEIQVEGLTTVFGNSGTENTTKNALRLVELVARPDVPVAAGAQKPLLRSLADDGWMVHGHNGLGEVEFPEPNSSPDRRHAAQFIIDSIMTNPHDITLVTLGPLTNVALALSLEPRISQLVKQIVLMGGAATVPGNVSAVAEANIHNDPEAASIVFHAGWPITMVGLDVTTKTIMSPVYMDRLRSAGTRYTDFIYAISRQYTNFYKQQGVDGFQVHDSSAIAYVIDPTLFTTKPVYVDIEYHSRHHYGQTVADWRGWREQEPNTHVCVDVDSRRFLDLYLQRLTEARA